MDFATFGAIDSLFSADPVLECSRRSFVSRSFVRERTAEKRRSGQGEAEKRPRVSRVLANGEFCRSVYAEERWSLNSDRTRFESDLADSACAFDATSKAWQLSSSVTGCPEGVLSEPRQVESTGENSGAHDVPSRRPAERLAVSIFLGRLR